MRIRIILASLVPLVSACTTPPPVSGTVANKDGSITVHPDGRFEITINPRSSK
ncbi:MAG: hypothetical protein J0M04_16455 [Verrucomicrobia bacterium]|nr:hypothetical protein [Verrucomicrobiota bacterium]